MTTTAEPKRDCRLQKFLSDAGVASRRYAEQLIQEGRVLVNDQIVDTLPAFVDPHRDVVVVNGHRVRARPLAYFIVHKPRGVVCTNYDPDGRPRAIDLLPRNLEHLFVVGRLDLHSSGVLLMTNDGELAARITHPRFGIVKVYKAEVAGYVPDDLPATLRRGVHLADGKAQASDVKILKRSRQESILEIALREGPNREVRRMLARVGHKVLRLQRVRLGPLTVRNLPPGAVRPLSEHEVEQLRHATRDAAASPPPPRSLRRRRFRDRPAQAAGSPVTGGRSRGHAAAPRDVATRGQRARREAPLRPAAAKPAPPKRRVIE